MKTQRFEDGLPPPNDGLFANPHDPIPRGTELLGKYTVERTLGKGGMGIVVAARHNALGELFAIKFLLPGALANREAVSRFLREARAAARLKRSEHVAHVHDVGELPNTGEPYMVMDYLDGQDLKSILRERPLPIDDAVAYLLQICDALTEAHRKGIIHRDLKPANLFLTTRANETRCIKVLDFGIARITGEDENLTKEGMLGSLKYMSPEQLLKSREVDARTDIWALGVVAYEFVTAKPPFEGNRPDLVANILGEPPEPPSRLRIDLPAAIEAVILRCLHKDRKERYQSVQEVEAALREAVGMPPMRPPMLSISIAEPIVLPIVPNNEQTNKTAAGMSITGQPPPSLRAKRVKVAVAGGSALATSAAVLGLVVALQGSNREQTPVNASSAPYVTASAMHIVLPDAAYVSGNNVGAEPIEVEQSAAKPASIGTTTDKTAQPIATNKAPSTSKTTELPAEPVPTATIEAPEPKPTTISKPPTPPVTATATNKRSTSPL